jgi:hypothetical protein
VWGTINKQESLLEIAFKHHKYALQRKDLVIIVDLKILYVYYVYSLPPTQRAQKIFDLLAAAMANGGVMKQSNTMGLQSVAPQEQDREFSLGHKLTSAMWLFCLWLQSLLSNGGCVHW